MPIAGSFNVGFPSRKGLSVWTHCAKVFRGAEALLERYEQVSAYHHDNYRPLMGIVLSTGPDGVVQGPDHPLRPFWRG
jgi:hypothetical protein